MFNTLENYHFQKLPQSFKDKAEKLIDDVSPLGILYEGTIDAVEVWGRDDILLLMQAMYNEARKEEKFDNSIVRYDELKDRKYVLVPYDEFQQGDEVIVQIRKKEENKDV